MKAAYVLALFLGVIVRLPLSSSANTNKKKKFLSGHGIFGKFFTKLVVAIPTVPPTRPPKTDPQREGVSSPPAEKKSS
jgi:hypothetical protein